MTRYVVNKNAQPGGEHEVHNLAVGVKKKCLPLPSNRKDLGYHNDCWWAILEAQKTYSNVDGCLYCATACHTR